jgi:hypothetical protein
VSADERPLSSVPSWLWVALAAALALQVGWQAMRAPPPRSAGALPAAPGAAAMRLAAFGEKAAASRLAMLTLQSFGLEGLDARRVLTWLDNALALDPRSAYPLFAAARVYAEAADPAGSRAFLAWIHAQFLRDPDRRWPSLAHAALLAKHRLRDLPLARRYAADLQRHVRDPNVPAWATQMEIFILEDMNELEAAKIMLGGLLESGKIRDDAEARFLKERLDALEARIGASKVK